MALKSLFRTDCTVCFSSDLGLPVTFKQQRRKQYATSPAVAAYISHRYKSSTGEIAGAAKLLVPSANLRLVIPLALFDLYIMMYAKIIFHASLTSNKKFLESRDSLCSNTLLGESN